MTTPEPRPRYLLALALFALTCLSTTYVSDTVRFSVPLMAILLAHELGHYVAARLHRVPSSLPYFIPLPLGPLGTLGALIMMPDRITRRDALLDIGAAGPLAGLVVAIPVLAFGIAESSVAPIDLTRPYVQEGHSLLYEAMLWAIKGPIPEGYDIQLGPTGFAGWVGLLVTMINLIPAAQLDGGHIAYALLGPRQARWSRRIRNGLLPLGVLVCASYGLPAFLAGQRGDALWANVAAGAPWLVWFLLLRVLVSRTRVEHPPTNDRTLSSGRRWVAWLTLGLFVLLFMPTWLRTVVPGTGPASVEALAGRRISCCPALPSAFELRWSSYPP